MKMKDHRTRSLTWLRSRSTTHPPSLPRIVVKASTCNIIEGIDTAIRI